MTMKVEGKIEVAACAQQTITWKNWENVAIYCYETFSDDSDDYILVLTW